MMRFKNKKDEVKKSLFSGEKNSNNENNQISIEILKQVSVHIILQNEYFETYLYRGYLVALQK